MAGAGTRAASLILAVIMACTLLFGCSAPEIKGGVSMIETGYSLKSYTSSDVLLTGEFFENAFNKEIDYLLSLDNDRLLCNFRKNGGVDWKGVEPYNGWENSLIGGHTMGHYLTALAQAYTSELASNSQKKAVGEKLGQIIDGLAECQRDSGFLWGAKVENFGNLEFQFDNVEQGKSNLFTEAWVPWYTMHKIFEGLISSYELAGNETALDIAKRLGDWVCERTSRWDESTQRTVLSIEYGGMNDCMYDLYRVTGEKKYAEAAHAFDEEPLFELIRTDGANVLNNRHANTTIPKIIGALKRYIVLGDCEEYLETAEIFWQMVVDHHTYPTGGNSEWEHFGEDDVLNRERTNCNCETCNVYNMLKLTKDLYMLTGDVKYADYYEQAFINHIMASQNPETGMTTYFQAMATGYFRTFSTPEDSFWCCTGTGMENFTKLGDGIYFSEGKRLFVNMYIESRLEASEYGLILTQSKTVPLTDTAELSLKLESDCELTISLRIPYWAKGDLEIAVNGEAVAYTENGGYADITRTWHSQDKITVRIPLGLSASNLQDGINTVSFSYGPVLLAADLGNESMSTTYTGMSVLIPESSVVESDTITLSEGITPAMVKSDPESYFVKGEGLEFSFTGSNDGLVFKPYYSLYNTRYGIFWRLLAADNG